MSNGDCNYISAKQWSQTCVLLFLPKQPKYRVLVNANINDRMLNLAHIRWLICTVTGIIYSKNTAMHLHCWGNSWLVQWSSAMTISAAWIKPYYVQKYSTHPPVSPSWSQVIQNWKAVLSFSKVGYWLHQNSKKI